jgi:NAD(P)-dependent dehydrogenase (short-subunit alcohol dehydrogenase family)
VAAQVVLLTGASRGFGAAAARLIAARGHTVVATMRDPQRDGPAVVDGLADRIRAVRLDVTVPTEVDAVVRDVLAEHGRVDVLINNAGYGLFGPAELGSEEQLWRQLDTNTFGPWRMIKAVLPAMRAQRSGKIVNVTSLSGRVVSPMLGHYAATKFALEALGEGLRFEVGALGVQVCNVEPGMYASDWQTGSLDVTTGVPGSAYAELVDARLVAFRELAATRPASSSWRSRCRCAGPSATRRRETSPSGPRGPTRSGRGCDAAACSARGAGPCTPTRRHRRRTTGRPATSCSSPARHAASARLRRGSWRGAATRSWRRCARRNATAPRSSPASKA